MTTVVVAPDGFKGSLTAGDAASAIGDGWCSVRPDDRVIARPVADGGEGTLDAFAAAVPGARRMPVVVDGPDGRPVDAAWLLLPPTADAPTGTGVVELASTSGLELLGDRRRPLDADTRGFGQAIAAALDHGASRLVLGIGSSASTDGGTGLLTALGARFADAAGRPIAPGARGLTDLAAAELTGLRPVPAGGVVVLTDVTNPLTGARGAAAVYGPQKGLAGVDIARADDGLGRLADLIDAAPVREAEASPDAAATSGTTPAPRAAPGSGAAGGAGFGLLVWGARLVPGAPEVATLVGLDAAIAAADLVITGEGSYDGQSAAGKAPAHVARLARDAGVPCVLVAGRIAPDADVAGFATSVSLTDLAGSPVDAMREPIRWLREAGAALARRSERSRRA